MASITWCLREPRPWPSASTTMTVPARSAGPSRGEPRSRAAGARSASCGPRVRRFRPSPESSGSPIPRPRRALGRSRTAGTTGTCPAQDHLCRLHLPGRTSTARVRCAGRRSMPGSAGHGNPSRIACTMQDIPPTPDDWSAGGWHVTGEEASRAPDAGEPRRPVPVHPSRPDHRGPRGADARGPRHRRERHRRRQARHALHGGRGLGLARDQDQAGRLRPGTDLLHDFRSSRSRRAHGGERARRASRRACASSWSCSPRRRRCPASTRTTRPRSPGPGGRPRSRRIVAFGRARPRGQAGEALPVVPSPPLVPGRSRGARHGRRERCENDRQTTTAAQALTESARGTISTAARRRAAANGGDRHRRALPPSGARGPGVRGQSPAGLQPPGPPLHAQRCRAACKRPGHGRLGRPDTASGVAR